MSIENSKVVNILNKLDNKELVRLVDYLSSPIFNKNTVLIAIAKEIIEYKNQSLNQLTQERLLEKCYQNKAQKVERLRNDLTLLFKLIKEFLSFEAANKYETFKNIALLKSLREKEMVKLFEKESQKLEELIKTNKEASSHLYKYLFYDELDQFFLDKRTRVYDEHLQLKMDALDNFYLTVKLREACEMLNRNAIYQKKYRLSLSNILDEILVSEDLPAFDSEIKVYHSTYKMLKSNTRADFETLLLLLDKEKMPNDQRRELYIHAQNFCTRNINKGDKAYFKDMFSIFQKLIAKELLLVDGFVPHTTYKNIVTVALNVDENDWAFKFIEAHKQFLKEELRESAYSYNLANYNYAIGEIDEAVKLLQAVHYEDNYYQIDARYLLLKIFYETNEHESLLYQIDAFKLYLKRNKDFNITTRELIITFLKLLRKTAILKHRKPYLSKEDFNKRLIKLNEQFMQNQGIPYRKWMESILESLNDGAK